MIPLVPLTPPILETAAVLNSVLAIVSVAVLLLATAYLTHKNSPLVIDGGVVLQPFSVPPLRAAVANVYVNVPLNAVGGVELLVFLAYNAIVAVLIPVAP